MATFQSTRSSCGPASISNALESLGIKRTEAELASLCGQTADGTSPKGIIKCLKAIGNGVKAEVFRERRDEVAVLGLWHSISERGRPFILLVDEFDHWVACVGHIGPRFVVVDSADNALVLFLSAPDLLARWVGPDGGYHAIAL